MPVDLTKRQQEIFDFIKSYSSKHGYPPTVRDIGKAVGLAEEPLDRRLLPHPRDDDLAVARGLLLAHHHEVALEDARVDHR
ncbi:MAG: LexA, partial [uncultured Solirubrobacteraceae bacterium]